MTPSYTAGALVGMGPYGGQPNFAGMGFPGQSPNNPNASQSVISNSPFVGGQNPFAMGSQPNAQGPSGAFNVPNNLFGQQGFMPQGFSGYNANNANLNQPQNGVMMGSFGSQSPYMPAMHGTAMPMGGMQNPYMVPMQGTAMPMGGSQQPQNPYGSMMQQQNPYMQQGNGLNPNTIDPSMISSQVAAGQGPGAAVDTTPAWQAMVQAQNYNVQQGSDQLAEEFNNGGGLFSNAYGSAQGQYLSNAKVQQNSQLTQGQLQSMLAAQGIQSNAASQVSAQGLQSNEAMLNYQNQLNGLGLQSATGMGNLYDTNLLAGGQLSGQQLGAYQNQDTAAYQNWYSAQPYNNPYLQMATGAVNQYPAQQQIQGWLSSLLGGTGSLLGGIGSLY